MPSSLRSKPWGHDGVAGGPNSLTILFDWLRTGDNYERWRSGDDKVGLYRELLGDFARHGIDHRTRSDANLMISHLQMTYNDAAKYAKAAGEDISRMRADDHSMSGWLPSNHATSGEDVDTGGFSPSSWKSAHVHPAPARSQDRR
ncbi:uncharacterized protein PGTG_09310 [Puccinia graminis f. sp. tritici CRL 75-36-700-3]|uniref:Uncharacterized protein n=1 Tax=Puccinia graminis f. sp. tritici (strain CRL 75-36-700-3 / race SCCL) TaxID=418459 RepID=E3KH22_PUCGT|nr:uncharacterized protein PGTG_09310 [Puccinia graminis f. sp. tritici CRL 75-36-700-3]EFP83597.2 hypothetical protein PGTG_09310 [Puccinia graminis f. sp. tritici CRL 75-36-700-3]